MGIPTKQLETEWGTFYATAVDGDTVRFRTTSPDPGDPEHKVTLNRLWYSADIEMTKRPPTRRYRHFVDDLWHVDLTDVSYRVRRYPAGGAPTDNALVAVRRRVLPRLAGWLRTPDGVALLDEGAAHQRADRLGRATAAETVVTAALGRVIRVQAMLNGGQSLSDEDDALVRHINEDLSRLVERADQSVTPPPPATSASPRAQAPEPPGL